MDKFKKHLVVSLALGLVLLGVNSNQKEDTSKIILDVYKTPTCGCCNFWVSHLEKSEIKTRTHDYDSLHEVKERFGIGEDLVSCHTGVSKSGYFFEGHIPAKFIQEFLMNPPAGAKGLAVPGMPMGSPGMEMGDRFTPYSIFLVKNDGSVEVYAEIKSKEDQY